jgi:hypothetical protein
MDGMAQGQPELPWSGTRHDTPGATMLTWKVWTDDDTPSLRAPKSIQPVILHLLASHEYLVIQVWDAVNAAPAPRPHAIDAENGRGLEIVTMLAHESGFYHPAGGGTTVWAALETSAALPPRTR